MHERLNLCAINFTVNTATIHPNIYRDMQMEEI